MIFKSHTRKIGILLCSAALLLFIGTLTAFAGKLPAGTAVSAAGTVLGDADNDGKVTIRDVTCVQRHIAELPATGSFSALGADADGNGEINIADASLLQQWLAEFETAYPIGEVIDIPQESTFAPATEPTQAPTDEDGWGREIFQP